MKLDIKNPVLFAKGKRGHLYKGVYKKKTVVVKTKNPESKAQGRINNECTWLKKLNKKNIGPTLVTCDENEMMYIYVEGEFIEPYAEKASKKEIIRIITNIFEQCFQMDQMGVDKEEMHHPIKHIICKKGKDPVMLDFERCHATLKPKNVTQFCQYIVSSKLTNIMKEKKIEFNKQHILLLAKSYKQDMSRKNLNLILTEITKKP